MKVRAGLPVIGIDALRVGLYVHLDLGWMSHPFALSHFKITTADELATIRALGLETLRWNPALSDPAPEECRRSTEGGCRARARGGHPGRPVGTPAGCATEAAHRAGAGHRHGGFGGRPGGRRTGARGAGPL
jgi:hypothetical protein